MDDVGATDDVEALKALTDTVSEGIIGIDCQGRLRTVDSAAQRIFGYSAAELIGEPISLLIPTAHAPGLQAEPSRFLGGGAQAVGVCRRVEGERKDGSTVQLEGWLSGEIRIGGDRLLVAVLREIGAHDAAERSLSVALQAVPIGIVMVDRGGVVRFANARTERLFGYSNSELIGQSVELLVPHGLREQHAAHRARFLAVPPTRAMGVGRSLFGQRKDGSAFPIEIGLSPLRTAQADFVVASIVDIRERRDAQAQQATLVSELAMLRAALDEHSIVAIADVQGTITYVNDKFCAISGYAREELLGKDHRIINSGHHSKAFIRTLWTTIARGNIWRGELKNRAKDGAFYWVDTTIVPYLNASGKPIQYVAIRTDVTTRKAADEQLAEKHRELEATARADRIRAQVMVALNRHVTVSSASAQVLRCLADEAGYSELALYSQDEWQGQLLLHTSLDGGAAVRIEVGQGLVGRAAAGREPSFSDPVDQRADGSGAEGGHRVGTRFAIPLIHREIVLGVLAGASSARLSERERSWLAQLGAQFAVGLYALQQFQDLEEVSAELAERTREVEAQNRALAQASRLKSQFLASMSHELRTPLNAIIGFSEVLKDGLLGDLDPGPLDYVSEIFQAGRHLLSLINDILDLSKIEAGRMELALESVDLGELARDALAIVQDRAAKGGLVVTHELSPGLESMDADARKLRQIVYNLLSNAVKFTAPGGTVRLVVTGIGAEVEFAVIDSGIGISSADQGRLFRAFEQLDGGLDRKFEGTGLGLALVRSLAQLHGGTCGVESELGRGSRFWVRLPRSGSPAGAAASAAQADACTAPGTQPPPVRPLEAPAGARAAAETARFPGPFGADTPQRILLISDDDAAAELVRIYLEDAGFTLARARSSAEALASFDELRPDLVTFDLSVAGVEGLSILSEHAERGQLDGVPVLILSGAGGPEKFAGLCAHSVLAKPVGRGQFLAVVQGLLGPRGTRRARVLVVDDDPKALKIIASYLSNERVELASAHSGEEALASIRRGCPDLLITDLMMPGVSGFDVLAALPSIPEAADLPVIILSAKEITAAERESLARSVTSTLAKATVTPGDLLERMYGLLDRGAIAGRGRDGGGR